MQMLQSNSYETLQSVVFALFAIYWLLYGPKSDRPLMLMPQIRRSKVEENLSVWPNRRGKFHADR